MSSQETASTRMFDFDFDFTLPPSYQEHHSGIDQFSLLDMKEDDFFQNRKPRKFSVGTEIGSETTWTHNYVEMLLEVFFHFHEKGIIWEELSVYTDEDNERFIRSLLHAVNTMNVFKKIDLSIDFCDEGEEHYDLCPGINSNNFIEELDISCQGTMSRGHCLALNNLLQANKACFQKLDILIDRRSRGDLEYRRILPGLRDNRTVKKIDFGFVTDGDDTDAFTSDLVSAVTRNPNLESLVFFLLSDNVFGDLSSEAFERLLSDSASLTELRVFGYSGTTIYKLNAECIIRGMKRSRSLTRLSLHRVLYGDFIFARFFRILPDCPFIEYLSFSLGRNFVLSEEELAQVKLLPRLPRPIHLHVKQEPFKEKMSDFQIKLLADLLRYHPEVRLILDYVSQQRDYEHKPEFLYTVNMNWYGRYLLDRPKVPLSIWPLVLAKVQDNDFVKDKASIIYGLLKGPAGAGRTSFENRVD